MSSSKAMHGFTMIELIVTISIFGILMALALPSFSISIANSKIRTSGESILNALQLTRSEAVRTNARVRFNLDGSTGGWTIRRSAGGTCEFATGAVVQSQPSTSNNTGVVVNTFSDGQAATTTTAQVYVYGPNGWQACPATGQFASLSIDSTAIAAADSRELRVVTPLVGRARLCDPNVAAGDTRACPNN